MALRALQSTPPDDFPEWEAPDAQPGDRYFAIYARISDSGEDEAKEQRTPGIERQVEDCERLAHTLGAKRIRYYREGGSAFSDKERPIFAQLLEDIEAGEISDVIAWRVERFARKPSDAEKLITAANADATDPSRVRAVIRTCDGMASDSEMGKIIFRQLVSFGRWESVSIGNRVRRARREAIEAGRFSGSPPAFGHRDGTKWREIVPEEAALIREGARRAVAGEGVRSILRDWHARGIRTRRGAPWQHRAWIKMVTSTRMVGIRKVGEAEYDGVDENGKPWIAPILDRDTWARLCEIFSDPARRPIHPGGTPKHLLTGLMRCGVCNGPLRAKGHSGKSHGPGYWTYGCVKDAYHLKACGRVWIKGSSTDEYIEGIVRTYLRMPAVRRALVRVVAGQATDPDDQLVTVRRDFADLQERIYEMEAASLDGPAALEQHGVSQEGYRRWRAERLAERDRLESQIGRLTRARATLRATADPEDFWDQATLEERRDLVRSFFEEISVKPSASVEGRPRRWDRKRIDWTPIEF